MRAQSRLGDRSFVPSDFHGWCGHCPHECIGPAETGSPDVFVNKRPALRVTDTGKHVECCGPKTWVAVEGSPSVKINRLPAHREGDKDQHCGGPGYMVDGSADVLVGD